MTRLAELILNSPAHARLLDAPPDPGAPTGAGEVADHIPVVVADAVSEFFFAGTTQETWEFARDFPNCTPPFSPVFVELTRPTRVVSGVHGFTGAAHLPARWGWRIEATSRAQLLDDDSRAAVLLSYHREYVDSLAASGLVDVALVERALDDPDRRGAARGLVGPEGGYFAAAAICRALGRLKAGAGDDGRGLGWLMHASLVVGRDGRAVGPVASLDMILDLGGRPSPVPLIDTYGCDGLTTVETAVLRATSLPLTLPAFMALNFLNTAGVTLRAVDPPPDLARRHAEQGLPAPVRYLVMDIGAVAGVGRN